MMDAASVSQAFEQHRDSVYRFTLGLTANTAAAEDIAQECFLDLLRRPNAFDPARASLKTYLLAAARNLVFKRWRSAGVEAELEDRFIAPNTPLSLALSAEIGNIVERAVRELPPLQRESLLLFEWEGLSLDDIAQVCCVEAGTVKSRLFRARETLKLSLAPYRNLISE